MEGGPATGGAHLRPAVAAPEPVSVGIRGATRLTCFACAATGLPRRRARASARATPVNSRATKSLQAHWKTVAPDLDSTPTWSVSQEKLAYIPPAEGTVPTSFRYKRGVFGAYLDKAVRLKVNLKSTAHG